MDRKKFLSTGGVDPKQRKALTGDFIPEDVHSYRINRPDFSIYLGGDPASNGGNEDAGLTEPGVDHYMADRFEINLGILSGISHTRPILVQMSSCGGSWDEGMKIFAAIATCPNPVTVVATKWARSMTSIIPLAADRFLIRPPASYMIHRGATTLTGLDQEVATQDLERRKANEVMMRLYIARLREQGSCAQWSERRIRTMIDESFEQHIDVWFSADDAVKLGFADGLFLGDWKNLRTTRKNMERRKTMLDVLRRPVKVDIKVS